MIHFIDEELLRKIKSFDLIYKWWFCVIHNLLERISLKAMDYIALIVIIITKTLFLRHFSGIQNGSSTWIWPDPNCR